MQGCDAGESPEAIRRAKRAAYSAAARARCRTDAAALAAVQEADRVRGRQRTARLAAERVALGELPRRVASLPGPDGETQHQRGIRLNRERRARIRELDQERHRAELDRLAERRRAKGPRTRTLSPEQHERRLETQRIRRASWTGPRVARPSGSVLACAAPSAWRDLLAEIERLVPRCDDREDVVAEAALLAVEGLDAVEAVARARRTVARSAQPYRTTRQIEECFWL